MSNVLIYIETRNGAAIKASLQALSEGARLAASLGGSAHAIVIGAQANGAELGKAGAAKVSQVSDSALANYSQDGYAEALAKLAQDNGASAVLCAATSQGKDLAPRVAAKLDAGYAADVTELTNNGGTISAKRPVYAGKAFIQIEQSSSIFVATTRPNFFDLSDSGAEVAAESVDLGIGEVKSSVVETISGESGKLDVAEADAIVSGGRGMKGPENWNLIEDLAGVLGAATGASRAVVDAGWRPHAEQVGQTGKTVSPNLYIAVGISGAIQHLAGMSSSKCIVAINKDPAAAIFKVADFGIVGDAFEVLPVLTEKLKAAVA